MATAPKLELRDGSGYTTNLTFSTNQEAVTLKGTLTTDTVAVQVSVNGGSFVTDANLLKIDLNTFTFPNPLVYPTGYTLGPGSNVISFRSIDIVGGVSAPATASITLIVNTALVDASTYIPTGVRVERRRNAVDVLAALPTTGVGTLNFRGFNFYASKTAAGTTGYYKINENPVPATSSTTEEVTYFVQTQTAMWSNSFRKLLRVRITEEDEFGNELMTRYDETLDAGEYFNKVRFDGVITSYGLPTYGKFTHNRAGASGTINTEQFAGVLDNQPLYYVVTGVYYDKTTNAEYESAYSQEVLGQPFVIDTAVMDLPSRTQTAIVTDYINLVNRVNSEVSLVPGSTSRDVSIDPFASEAERLWFLMDYVHRSQSFLTLLQIDDAANTGTSDPVSTSAYKTALKSALGYSVNDTVQSLINLQFDKLAANVNKKRLNGRPATGQVVFYTTTKPSVDITIPAGSTVGTTEDATTGVGAVEFVVGGTYVLPAANSEAFYNYTTKRYEVVADIGQTSAGTVGNVPAGTITNTTVPGLSVTNTESTVGGTDAETNAELAARCILSFASVDTGTESGYYQTAAEQIGIIKSKVVKSGDRLMMRDWDPLRKKHIGGKVDIWVQGLRERQVTENFAFSFEVARDIQCRVVDPVTLTFRVLDSRVTPTTPIIEMINIPSQGFGVRNATVGQDYDLTDVQVIDYQTFRLSTVVAQPTTALDDVVYADYRFRFDNKFVFSFQPVRRITSVVGEVSGSLTPDVNYKLYKPDDPLLEGESTVASNYISVIQAAGKPVGNQLTVNDEVHVLIGFVQEPLDSIGINTNTIRVFNAARTVEYTTPSDFEVISGTDRTPPKIVRTSTSTISTGQEVSVDYTKDENFTVSYVINDLLQQLQTVVDSRRHVTADVIVKQTVVNPIDIETTVQLKKGSTKDKVDPAIRSNVSLELNRRVIGQGIAQSDVINAVDSTDGVDYEIVPLARMAYSDGSLILRESVLSDFTYVSSLDAGGQRVYLLIDALNYPTTNNGGYSTEHRGVFQDDLALKLVEDPMLVGSAEGQAYIIGSDGLVIPGLTTQATAKTVANRVLVSLPYTASNPDVPTAHSYGVSYQVRGDSGAHDVYGSEVEYVDLGNFTITYRAG